MAAFTIRVQRAGRHDVYACARYAVSGGAVRGTCRVELIGTPEGDQTINIGEDESAYVMNESGRTVDTIRPPSGHRSATSFRTGSHS